MFSFSISLFPLMNLGMADDLGQVVLNRHTAALVDDQELTFLYEMKMELRTRVMVSTSASWRTFRSKITSLVS